MHHSDSCCIGVVHIDFLILWDPTTITTTIWTNKPKRAQKLWSSSFMSNQMQNNK